jgi:HD-like signal output (HDOD) protein
MSGKFQNINYELDKLPTMPLVASQMIQLINAPDTSANQLAKVVEKDPAVAARVLKIANSSFYSMSRQVTTLSTAIVILGERTLKNLVLAASLRGMHQSFGNIEQMLWEDSMVCALASRFLARKLHLADPEEAFMAGLFRHIGKVVLNNQDAGAKQLLSQMMTSGERDLAETERASFGATHAEIGAAVLEHWRLSEALSLVALHHYDVDLSGIDDQNASNLICLVNIASEFPAIFGIFGPPQEIDLAALPGARVLQLDAEKLAELLAEFHNVFEENREEFLS